LKFISCNNHELPIVRELKKGLASITKIFFSSAFCFKEILITLAEII